MAATTREEILNRINSRAVLTKLPTPEHHASIVQEMADADQLVWVKLGPNEYHLTARELVAPEVLSKGEMVPDRQGGSVLRIKMQKSVFMTLPDCAYLVSGVKNGDGSPVFCGCAGPLSERPQLWERLKRRGADGRFHCVFPDEASGLADVEESMKRHAEWAALRQRA